MKVGPFGRIIETITGLGPLGVVREKSGNDASGSPYQHADGGGSQSESRTKKEHPVELSPPEEPEVTEAELFKAIEVFSADTGQKTRGLRVALLADEGSALGSPHTSGLKVVLSDASGKRIREMPAREFLLLKESLLGGQNTKGKILDQKL